jgi:hypothetical protein
MRFKELYEVSHPMKEKDAHKYPTHKIHINTGVFRGGKATLIFTPDEIQIGNEDGNDILVHFDNEDIIRNFMNAAEKNSYADTDNRWNDISVPGMRWTKVVIAQNASTSSNRLFAYHALLQAKKEKLIS